MRTTTVQAYFIMVTDTQVQVANTPDVMHQDYAVFWLPLSECTFDNDLDKLDTHGYEEVRVTLPLWLQDKTEFFELD